MGNGHGTVVFDDYKVTHRKQIAEGGFGYVSLVEDEKGHKFAMKRVIVPLDDTERNNVARSEQVVLSGLVNHPNIVHFYGACQLEILEKKQRHYCTLLEYCNGNVWETMVEFKNRGEKLSEKRICSIFRDACFAIHHLHSQMPPIAHRDLKVENLLFGLDGNIKLTDFGSCTTEHGIWSNSRDIKSKEEEISKHTTLAYRSPEQVDLYLRKKVCEKVDIWALGVLLFVLTTERTPFADSQGNVEKMGILSGRYRFPGDWAYSKGIRDFIAVLLNPDPDERPSIHDVLAYGAASMESGALPDWPGLQSNSAIWPSSDVCEIIPPSSSSRHRKPSASSSQQTKKTQSVSPPQPVSVSSDRRKNSSAHASATSSSVARSGSMDKSSSPEQGQRQEQGQGVYSEAFMKECVTWEDESACEITQSHARSSTRDDGRRAVAPNAHRKTSTSATSPVIRSGSGSSGRQKDDRTSQPAFPQTHFRSSSSAVGIRGAITEKAKLVGGSITSFVSAAAKSDRELEMLGWVKKATNGSCGFPKAKHLRYIVVALWESEMTVDWLLEKLSQRPWSESALISCKVLVTLMKVMQQGPPTALALYIRHLEFVEQMERHWANYSAIMSINLKNSFPSGENANYADRSTRVMKENGPKMTAVVCTLAALLREKSHFHSIHPEFSTHFTTFAALTSKSTLPSDLSKSGIVGVLTQLMSIQSGIELTQRSIFLTSSARDEYVDNNDNTFPPREEVITAQASLLPVLEESYVIFVACVHLLEALYNESNSSVSGQLTPLRGQFDQQYESLKKFYLQCKTVPFVVNMDCIPVLPEINPLSEVKKGSSKTATRNAETISVRPTEGNSEPDGDNWDPFFSSTANQRKEFFPFWKSTAGPVSMPSVQGAQSHFTALEARLSRKGTDLGQVREEEEEAEFDPFCLYTTLPEATENVTLPPSAPAVNASFQGQFSDWGPESIAASSTTTTTGNTQIHQRSMLEEVADFASFGDKTCVASLQVSQQQQQSDPFSVSPSFVAFDNSDPFMTIRTTSGGPHTAFAAFTHDENLFTSSQQPAIKAPVAPSILPTYISRDNGALQSQSFGTFNAFDAFETTPFGAFSSSSTPVDGRNGLRSTAGSAKEVVNTLDPSGAMSNQVNAVYTPALQPWREEAAMALADSALQSALTHCLGSFASWGREISFHALEVERVIGTGAFAVVYKAKIKANGVNVAVKKLLSTAGQQLTAKSLRDFEAEVGFMQSLRHPNIVELLATCSMPVSVLIEFCDRGNLMSVLQDTSLDLSLQLRQSLMADIALGMSYLHSQNPIVIHRDLKSLNILVTNDWVAKITDFGLSRLSAEADQNNMMTGQIGTFHWMAPEVINGTDYTAKADIYSFAIIAWELLTRLTPYQGMHPVQIVAAVCNSNLRPIIPPDTTPELATLIRQSWSASPSERPSFREIHSKLKDLM